MTELKMTALEMWLKRATRYLSADAAAQVRREIEEHFDAAREAAMREGLSEAEAERTAVAALGDSGVANRQYRRVLLTKEEARLLRESAWESNRVCSRGWIRWFAGITALVAAVAGVWALIAGATMLTKIFLMTAVGTGLVAAPMFFPLFTPMRGLAYRTIKWALLAALLVFIFGMHRNSWLFFVIVWPMMWTEWKRIAIRRKMPQADWPKHLYL